MTKDEDRNDEQLLANICKLWKWALILNRLGPRDQIRRHCSGAGCVVALN